MPRRDGVNVHEAGAPPSGVNVMGCHVRRLRIRRAVARAECQYIADGLLWIAIVTGLAFTLGYNLLNGPYEYRSTIGVWIRGVLTLHPTVSLMAGVPLILQVHIALAFLLFGISPFTRLIHIYSFPVAYLTRAPLLYRARYGYSYGREHQPQPQPPASQLPPQWVPPPPTVPAEEPSREPSLLEPVDEVERVLVRVTEPVRWLWQHPHVTGVTGSDQRPHAIP